MCLAATDQQESFQQLRLSISVVRRHVDHATRDLSNISFLR